MGAPVDGCILNLSCVYAGVLLAVLLTLFFTCVAIFYLERRQRAKFPDLPGMPSIEIQLDKPRTYTSVRARIVQL